MENVFKINHVSKIVSKNQVVPPMEVEGELNPLYEEWLKKIWIVLGWIQAAIGPPMYSLVMNHKMAADCWLMLETHLSPRKVIQSQSIRDQLKALKKSDDESMSNFIIKVHLSLIVSQPLVTDHATLTSSILWPTDLGLSFGPSSNSIYSRPNVLFDDFLQFVSVKAHYTITGDDDYNFCGQKFISILTNSLQQYI